MKTDPKDKILDCATELFSKKGFEGASVREIASAAGVNVAMINYYFGDKEGLFEKIIEERLSYLRDIFADLVKDHSLTALEKIYRIIDLVINRKFSSARFHLLLHRELSMVNRTELKEKISDLLMLNISPVKQIIREGIRTGEFRKVDVEMTVTTLVGAVHYLSSSEIMTRKILGRKEGFSAFQNKQLKKRLSEHTKLLMRSFLLK